MFCSTRNAMLATACLLFGQAFIVVNSFLSTSPPTYLLGRRSSTTTPTFLARNQRTYDSVSSKNKSRKASGSQVITRPKRRTWEENLEKLIEYKETHGDCNVPRRYKEDTRLANFVDKQRKAYRDGKLKEDKQTKLDAIGFDWDGLAVKQQRLDDSWDKMLQQLKDYKNEHGDCNVPQKYAKLSNFMQWQRNRFRVGLLKEDRRAKLDAIGFEWDGPAAQRQRLAESWDIMLQQLKDYKDEHGDCDVPNNFKENPTLANWVRFQREHRAYLTESHHTSLDNLGFTWEEAHKKRYDQLWNERFAELTKFQRRFGHTRVPQRWGQNPQLGEWVCKQRQKYRQKILPADRQAKLEAINFTWRLREAPNTDDDRFHKRWLKSYKKLQAFQKEHNHTIVPVAYREDPPLGKWVARQREYYQNKLLKENRRALLDEIGFVWSFENARWEVWMTRYRDLVAFQETHGHLIVPEPTVLYSWIRFQRLLNSNGKLEPHRKAMLDKIDFDWS